MWGSRPGLAGRSVFVILSSAAIGTLSVSAVSPHLSEFADSSGTVSICSTTSANRHEQSVFSIDRHKRPCMFDVPSGQRRHEFEQRQRAGGVRVNAR